MKVAYILNTPNAANYKVGTMILPQLEEDRHGVDVLGIFFFDDNAFMLRKGDPKGERLAKVAKEKGMKTILVTRNKENKCNQYADLTISLIL